MRKKILVVDDDQSYLATLHGMLGRMGHLVEECRFGANVLSRLLQKDIDLVVMDYLMPDEKGYVISRHIKTMESLKRIPIIIVTGHHELAEEFFKSMGAEEVIYKPVTYEDLADKVKRCLGS